MKNFILRLFSLLLLPAWLGPGGCGGTDPASLDDLSRLPLAREGTVMETQVQNPLVWVRVSNETIRCVRSPCPLCEVYGVDGSQGRLVYAFDLSALGMGQTQQGKFQDSLRHMLLRGRYADSILQDESVVVFQVIAALEPATAGTEETPQSNDYYQVTVGNVAPDDSWITWQARPLRPGPTQSWGSLDFSGLGLSGSGETMLYLEMRSHGVYVSAQPTVGGIPRLTQVFLPLGSPPLPAQ